MLICRAGFSARVRKDYAAGDVLDAP